MIELQNVSFSYPGDACGGLKNISLTIPDGQFVLLCGRSGCGKTTLTRLANGLIPQFFAGELTGRVLLRIPGSLSAGFEFGGQPRGQRGAGMLCTICRCLSSFQIP